MDTVSLNAVLGMKTIQYKLESGKTELRRETIATF